MPAPNTYRRVSSYYGGASPTPLGTIFEDDFARASLGTDYIATGATWGADGTKGTVTFGGSLFTSTLAYSKDSYTSNLEWWKQTLTYNVGSQDGFGLAFGVNGNFPLYCNLFLSAIEGKIRFYQPNGDGAPTIFPESPGTMTINPSDEITGVLEYYKGLISVTYTNHTTPGVLSHSHQMLLSYPFAGVGYVQGNQTYTPGKFQPCLNSFGGTQSWTNWKFESDTLKNTNILFIGDSITSAFFAGSFANRWPELAADTLSKSCVIYAGANNSSNQFNTDEIIDLLPTKAIISIGTNDKNGGTSNADIMTRITNLITPLENAGIVVELCQIPPNDSVDMTSFNALLVTTFGARVKYDFWNLLKNGTAYAVGMSDDGTHPSSAAQALMAAEISDNF